MWSVVLLLVCCQLVPITVESICPLFGLIIYIFAPHVVASVPLTGLCPGGSDVNTHPLLHIIPPMFQCASKNVRMTVAITESSMRIYICLPPSSQSASECAAVCGGGWAITTERHRAAQMDRPVKVSGKRDTWNLFEESPESRLKLIVEIGGEKRNLTSEDTFFFLFAHEKRKNVLKQWGKKSLSSHFIHYNDLVITLVPLLIMADKEITFKSR